MTKQLNIRSDEAYERAHRVAKKLGTTTTEAVVRALRRIDAEAEGPLTYADLTPQQQAELDRVLEIARQARAEMTNPGFSEDDLYDENGLPK